MNTDSSLPRWDVSTVYPGLDSPEFARDRNQLIDGIAGLDRMLARHRGERESGPGLDAAAVTAVEDVLAAFEAIQEKLHTMLAYVRSFVTTDSFDDAAQAAESELRQHTIQLSKATTRITAWIGSMDIDLLTHRSERAARLEYPLHLMQVAASHQMSLPEEDLASELEPSGGTAWAKLYATVASQILVSIEIGGETRVEPMSQIRILAHDADRAVRRRAYEAELVAWKRASVPLAAALNSIKGESNAIQSRRGWESPLDFALMINHIDHETLSALMGAARASFPDFRRYLKAKARVLGIPRLAWYDLFAPVGQSTRQWEYPDGQAFLLEQFGSYSPRLRSFAERAFRENWIDVGPRPGKVGGAFCMWLRRDESRVLANYIPSYDGVSTVAHELGHAYHNFNLGGRSILERQTPMTLAETASIFCETIIEHAALEISTEGEQIAILEASLQGSCQVVVDIISRFDFESAVFERRLARDLSVEELNGLMLDSQRATYGDALDAGTLHEYQWAAKGHYYGTERPFYNFPYLFGLLFGLGLYARYQREPEGFQSAYDELLSSTGLADAATIAGRFGIDIQSPEFWTASLDVLRESIDRFDALVALGAKSSE